MRNRESRRHPRAASIVSVGELRAYGSDNYHANSEKHEGHPGLSSSSILDHFSVGPRPLKRSSEDVNVFLVTYFPREPT